MNLHRESSSTARRGPQADMVSFPSLITNPVLPSQPSAILMTSDGVPTSSLLRSSMSPLAMNAPSAPADLAQANDAVDQGSNIFVPNNRLFPLGIASVAVGGKRLYPCVNDP
jgi:hypothetical protein